MVDDGIYIINRFFFCVDLIKDNGRMVGGQKAFCEKHDIRPPYFSYMRSHAASTSMRAEWIKWLCEDYGVNANYILFGKGKILNEQ